MKNVTKILTAVVLCAAVFASTQRTDALGGNPAFWPGDEANIAAFPAQLSNHGYVQITNMGNGNVDGSAANGSVGMVFDHGGHTWGLSFSDSAEDFMNLSWGKEGMGLSLNYKMWTSAQTDNSLTWTAQVGTAASADYAPASEDYQAASEDYAAAFCSDAAYDNQTDCEANAGTWTAQVGTAQVGTAQVGTAASGDYAAAFCSDGVALNEAACTNYAPGVSYSGYGLSFGYDLGDMGEIGVHMMSGDGHTEGFKIDYRKSCGFWVFTDMVAHIDSPKDGDMTLDVDWFGHMDAGVADVMLATGMVYDMADTGGMTLTSNLGVEAAVTDNITVRGGMNWAYDLTNDGGDQTGAVDGTVNGSENDLKYSWSTGAGINFGSFNADFDLGTHFWNNPLGWVSGQDDDAVWSNLTVTYSF